EFRAFVGDDVLIAHNGQHFDIPVLRRVGAGQDGVDDLLFYDTLPLARSLSRDSAKLEDLALRFGIDAGRAHHALDDAVTLARVYRELERRRAIRAWRAGHGEAISSRGGPPAGADGRALNRVLTPCPPLHYVERGDARREHRSAARARRALHVGGHRSRARSRQPPHVALDQGVGVLARVHRGRGGLADHGLSRVDGGAAGRAAAGPEAVVR